MKRSLLCVLGAAALLAGCGKSPSMTINELLSNPLFAERYSEELVNYLVDLEVYEHEASKDPAKKAIIESEREKWMEVARTAREQQRHGGEGAFIPLTSEVFGEALYLDNVLYLSSTFETSPGPNLHIYLTTGVDPRDGFPDPDTIDLGPVKSPYGVQQYEVPEVANRLLYRTVVLHDKDMDLLFGFAQLSLVADAIAE